MFPDDPCEMGYDAVGNPLDVTELHRKLRSLFDNLQKLEHGTNWLRDEEVADRWPLYGEPGFGSRSLDGLWWLSCAYEDILDQSDVAREPESP
jgi:hypothetical protein